MTYNAVKWYREQDGKKGLENTYCNLLVDPLAMIFLRASPKTEYGVVCGSSDQGTIIWQGPMGATKHKKGNNICW